MDDIANWLYALCCLLPFLAFILLVKQMYGGRKLIKKLNTPFISQNKPNIQHQDITIIMNQLQQPTITHDYATDKSLSTNYSAGKSQSLSSTLHQKYHQNIASNSRTLSKCNAGIAKINSINKKYLSCKFMGKIETYLQQMKRNRNKMRNNKKELFESTLLPIIIEGLQY